MKNYLPKITDKLYICWLFDIKCSKKKIYWSSKCVSLKIKDLNMRENSINVYSNSKHSKLNTKQELKKNKLIE